GGHHARRLVRRVPAVAAQGLSGDAGGGPAAVPDDRALVPHRRPPPGAVDGRVARLVPRPPAGRRLPPARAAGAAVRDGGRGVARVPGLARPRPAPPALAPAPRLRAGHGRAGGVGARPVPLPPGPSDAGDRRPGAAGRLPAARPAPPGGPPGRARLQLARAGVRPGDDRPGQRRAVRPRQHALRGRGRPGVRRAPGRAVHERLRGRAAPGPARRRYAGGRAQGTGGAVADRPPVQAGPPDPRARRRRRLPDHPPQPGRRRSAGSHRADGAERRRGLPLPRSPLRRDPAAVRAARLMSLVLLLQGRGGMTAAELARELEVSERTVHRDVLALSSAGIPVYAERGGGGGDRLLEGYRTRLTGLDRAEAEALFLSGVPAALREMGLEEVAATARLKAAAALSPGLRDAPATAAQRFHLDAPGWFATGSPPPPQLAPLARAVWSDRRVTAVYKERSRALEPYGLVLKAGVWYLAARLPGRARFLLFRVDRFGEITVLDQTFDRDPGFDLAAFWDEQAEAFRRSLLRTS